MSEMNALAEAAAIRKRDATDVAIPTSDAPSSASPGQERPRKIRKSDLPREERLLQNRQAASEARRRKREMVEDLQRSVAFFSKSNASLKSRNAELERQILIARQRIACGDTQGGVASAAGAAGLNNVMLKSNIKDEEKEAMAARFAATQAMYKSMGFPPAAARQAATTFSTYTPNHDVGLSLSSPSSTTSPVIAAPDVKQDDAQAAHFAATQALYKSMGFPPRAAKEAAATFSHCHQLGVSPALSSIAPMAAASVATQPKLSPPNVQVAHTQPQLIQSLPPASYLEALNKYAMQQTLAANAAASVAAAAMHAARMQASNGQGAFNAQAPTVSSATVHEELSKMNNRQLSELFVQLQSQNSKK